MTREGTSKVNPELAVVKAMGRKRKRLRMPRFASRPAYVPVMKAWTWANATPWERGESVRHTSLSALPLSFEPAGDGMAACIHDANGAIICEAKYDDFEDDVTRPERAMKMLVEALAALDNSS